MKLEQNQSYFDEQLVFCGGRMKDYLLYILYLGSPFEGELDLLSHVFRYLEPTRLAPFNDVEQVLLTQPLHRLLHRPLDPLLLMEEIVIEILLDVLLLFGEVHLLKQQLSLLFLEGRLLLRRWQMVVDYHSVDVVFQDDSRGRALVGQSVPCVETL